MTGMWASAPETATTASDNSYLVLMNLLDDVIGGGDKFADLQNALNLHAKSLSDDDQMEVLMGIDDALANFQELPEKSLMMNQILQDSLADCFSQEVCDRYNQLHPRSSTPSTP